MLRIYNTLSRELEEFKPITPGKVGYYSCGPTVYDYAHIGNLRTYIYTDILKRALAANGLEVKHIMNLTDVGHLTDDGDYGQDKLEKGAAREGKSAWDIAKFYTDAFMRDMTALNIKPPTEYTRATDFIPEQIALAQKLEAKGYTYTIPGDGLYFDVSKFPSYTALGRQNLDEIVGGARIGANEGKRNPADFALWKFSPENEKRQMEWDSPWGVGFPGWAIECSAMAIDRLGPRLDIHSGGEDHIQTHHSNEIAQSECALGHKWCNYWVHAYFLNDKTGKMSKSKGEFMTLDWLRERGYDPMDYRYLCLTASYRTQMTLSFEALDSAKKTRENLVRRVAAMIADPLYADDSLPDAVEVDAIRAEFLETLNEDLNTAAVLARLQSAIKDSKLSDKTKLSVVKYADELLGLRLLDYAQTEQGNAEVEITPALAKLIQDRMDAKAAKDYARADSIRDTLAGMGYDIKDEKDGAKLIRRGS